MCCFNAQHMAEPAAGGLIQIMTNIEVTAVYLGEKFRFNNSDGATIISEVDIVGDLPNGTPKRLSIKGPGNGFQIHHTYRLFGRWTKYRNKRTGEDEQQFTYTSSVEAQPASRAGVIRYIADAGKGNGIGTGLAAKIWEKFGQDGVRLLREEPEAISGAIKGISVDKAKLTGLELTKKAHIEACSIELLELLDRRGFPKAVHRRAIQKWGNAAAAFIRRSPYVLMEFRGVGFKGTDAMYLDLDHNPARIKRQALCAWYSLASDTNGNTWLPAEHAIQGIRDSVAGAQLKPVEALTLAKRARIIETLRTHPTGGQIVDQGGNLWVAEGKKARGERFVARQVVDSLDEPTHWPTIEKIREAQPKLTDHQYERLADSLKSSICLFGGSPGTGKTFAAAALIKAIVQEYGDLVVAIAAPTGKAAVRVTEALQEYGIDLRAKTIHSTLQIDQVGNGSGGWTFKYREGNPLPFKFIVVDESSMIPTDLMASLLAARAKGTHVFFVGDVHQLPPVGHGAPLRDFIAAGIPYGELREIQRNAGRIVKACAQIRDGEKFEVSPGMDLDAGENLYLLGGDSSEEMLTTLDGIFEAIKILGFDPVWETQVVVPVNRKSDMSRVALNRKLQELLNDNPGQKGVVFRKADKIVNTKNGWYTAVDLDVSSPDLQTNDQGEVYVANGELAEIVEVHDKLVVAKLNNPSRVIKIPRGSQEKESTEDSEAPSTGCSWDLGYAISVHKSQGSEWGVVIVVLDEYPGARMVADRGWVYTAISRAKKLCLLLGKLETAHRFCRQTKIHQRKTFLAELIKWEVAKKMVHDI